ncbi:MAG: molybdopterin-dependent oxidoreductase [Gammaproteobacteria bacterium]|nr:molybdopterin-dependent oxidoreductase [Gammaproteobacteria bacterium]MBU1625580.1 molybdopterin-dependent oxidoreductase [Gammaproteobacteria bacterium]MBU1980840.1 molybdopterin-dependent oxidoreductase [Gammaproteobacteria bacterium]
MIAPKAIRTACPYCGVGCGVLATVAEDGAVRVSGDAQHPANLGRLCSKGAALAETLGGDGRLLHPVVDGAQASWEVALARVADGFKQVITEHGPEAVAFYVSGQLLTEDYYVANKLMKGFIGSANIDTNSRLCMSTAVAAHKRAFGADAVPVCYEDIEAADLVVIVGSNYAWAHPVLYQRLAAAKKARPEMRVVVVDPRRTATCDIADLHLAIVPGSDAYLFNGLLHHLRREDALDLAYVEAHVEGFAAAFEAARSVNSIPAVAQVCGVAETDIGEFFRLFARTERCVTIFSQGINQSSSGVDKANAIINVHLATGRIGRPGMGPFSVTGQPNAMGGREVGGLANQLAAHMDFSDAASINLVARFWDAPNIAQQPGLKAVDMFQAIADGKIKAVWIMGTNPVVSMPDADRVRAALLDCELVVVSDCVLHTDTTACADILLPAAGWGEKDGAVTNSERRISRQRAFLPAAGEARPDWWIITQVAQRMGFGAAFAYSRPAQIFNEHARLSGFENAGQRAFDISALSGLDESAYDALQPLQWPLDARSPAGTQRMFADGKFCTPSGKAHMVAVAPCLPAVSTDDDFPLRLNTGRIRDQWHTMTRTGKVPRLNAHQWEPFVQIHAHDAEDRLLQDGTLARITSRHGTMLARVQVSAEQRIGSLFAPMHWSDAFAKAARVDALVAPITDPISGQPESKHTPVRIEPYRPAWQGFVLSRNRLELPGADYCASSQGDGYWRHELAGELAPEDWRSWAKSAHGGGGEWMEFHDAAMGRYRAACVLDGKLESVFFIASDHRLPEREWLGSLFANRALSVVEMAGLLSARPPKGAVTDAGRVVCACFSVGEKTLVNAIQTNGLTSIEEVGALLKAGTGCGSCVPEIRRLIPKVKT